jgi:hypothetical protein
MHWQCWDSWGVLPIDVTEFATVFRDSGIRSWLDWDRIISSNYSVEQIVSRSIFALGELETVWYIQPDGSRGDWREQDSRRVCVQEAARLTNFPNTESSAYISHLAAQMEKAATPTILTLPSYMAKTGQLLILDGNHRAVAAFKAKRDVRLLIFAIKGTDNPYVLPDLLHETYGGATPEAWAMRRAEIEHRFTES